MSAKPPTSQASGAEPVENRSAVPHAKPGTLGWVRDVLGRSISLEQRRNPPHGALVDPLRNEAADNALSILMQQRAELGARLLVHDPATQVVRHLFFVHDELRNGGWPAVGALPLKVIDRALTEAEMLGTDEPSPLLTAIIDNLREMKVAADITAAPEAPESEWETPPIPEVSDTNFDEYELMERSWAGTIPAGLKLPSRDSI